MFSLGGEREKREHVDRLGGVLGPHRAVAAENENGHLHVHRHLLRRTLLHALFKVHLAALPIIGLLDGERGQKEQDAPRRRDGREMPFDDAEDLASRKRPPRRSERNTGEKNERNSYVGLRH